jgi:hypothetical protein
MYDQTGTDNEQSGIIQEAASGTIEETGQEVAQEPQQQQVEPKPIIKENQQAVNFRAIKAQKEQAERERDEALRLMQEIKDSQQPNDLDLKDDDIVEPKHISKVDKRIKDLEKKVNEYQRKTEAMTVDSKLSLEHSDFFNVVTADNIKKLAEGYPELAETLRSTGDKYAQGKSAYTLIKKLVVSSEDPQAQEKLVMEKNSSKARSASSVSPSQIDSPLGIANAFSGPMTEDLRKQLLKKMDIDRRMN